VENHFEESPPIWQNMQLGWNYTFCLDFV